MDKVYQDREWLIEHYCEQELSAWECAKLAGCSKDAVLYWLEKCGLPKRTHGALTERHRQRLSDALKAAHARGAYVNRYNEESRQKKSKSMKAAWERGDFTDRFTKDVRQKISEAMKMSWERGDRDNEETRRKMSEAAKARHARGDHADMYTEEYRQKISEGVKAAHARGDFDGVFQSPTSIEIAISEALDELGVIHIKQFRPDSCSYTYDEYLPMSGILLEINGTYWHSLPGVPEKDVRKADWARDNGFLPITIWEHEIKEHGALAMVDQALRRR